MSKYVALRRLVEFNPSVPQSVRLVPERNARLFSMDAIQHFDEPYEGHIRPIGKLLHGYAYIEPTDVAYAKVTPCFENGKGLIGTDLDKFAFASSEVTVLRPGPQLDQRYLSYILRSELFRCPAIASMTGAGGLKRVNEQDMRDLKVWLPPIGEQQAIANYLDREITGIDAFIADQKRLIELLEERRAATITHAVTKGLDPDVPVKDSGVEWIGHVPDHWKVTRLKNSILEAKNGVWGLEPDGSELDLRCVRVADFDRPRLSIHDRNSTLRKIPFNEQKGRILKKGDLLLEKSGGGEKSPVGFVVLYDGDEPAVCSNFVARLVIRPGMDSQFWTYLHSMLYSRRLTQRSIKQTTGIQNLDQANYFNELVAFPTDKEQCDIAEFLERETAEFDAAVSDAREAIALSRERRAALISAAVTGQLDVSQAQRPVGEVSEEQGVWV